MGSSTTSSGLISTRNIKILSNQPDTISFIDWSLELRSLLAATGHLEALEEGDKSLIAMAKSKEPEVKAEYKRLKQMSHAIYSILISFTSDGPRSRIAHIEDMSGITAYGILQGAYRKPRRKSRTTLQRCNTN